MRKILPFLAAFLVIGRTEAGPVELEPKETAPAAPEITDNDHWYFNLGSPGWLANLSGTVGLQGINSNVDVFFDQLLKHSNFIVSVSADVRRGRWGVYGDFLNLELADAVYPEGVLSKADINLDQWLADAELYYRVWAGPRGWLDLRAGARYTDLYSRLQLFGNGRLIDQAATDLANAIDSDLRRVLERLLKGGLDNGHSRLPIPPLGAVEKVKLLRLIRTARQDPLTAQAKIATVLNAELNRTISLTERWTDPYIGISGHYDLNKVFYLTGRADVGGFGVGSDISTQVWGGIGCHVTRWMYTEIGYRFLYVNFEDDSNRFLWRTETWGPQINSGITF